MFNFTSNQTRISTHLFYNAFQRTKRDFQIRNICSKVKVLPFFPFKEQYTQFAFGSSLTEMTHLKNSSAHSKHIAIFCLALGVTGAIVCNAQVAHAEKAGDKELKFNHETFDYAKFEELQAQSIDMLDKIKGKDLILYLGDTGSFKSTNTNYMHGHTMKREPHPENPKRSIIVVDGEATFPIGHTNNSKTLFTQAEISEEGACNCDSPGFDENRGIEYEIAVSHNLYTTTQMANSIKGIVVMIPKAALEIGRGKNLKNLAKTLGTFLKHPENCAESIFFIITNSEIEKPKKNWPWEKEPRWKVKPVDKESVIFDLKRLSKDLGERKNLVSLQEKKLIDLMIENESNIITDFDPLDDGKSRKSLIDEIQKKTSIEKGQFSSDIIGGDNRLAFQHFAGQILSKGTDALHCEKRIRESQEKQKRHQILLDETLKKTTLNEQKLKEEITKLSNSKKARETSVTSAENKIEDELNIDTNVSYWEKNWQSDSFAITDGFWHIFGEVRSYQFNYRQPNLPYKEPRLIDNSRNGFYSDTKKNINKGFNKVIYTMSERGKLIASGVEVFGGGIVLITPSFILSADSAKHGLDAIQRGVDRANQILSDIGSKEHKVFDIPPPIEFKVAFDERSNGRFEARASVLESGAIVDVTVSIDGPKNKKPDVVLTIDNLKKEITADRQEIVRLDDAITNLKTMHDHAELAKSLKKMIDEENGLQEENNQKLSSLSISEAMQEKNYKLAKAIESIEGFNIDHVLTENFIGLYQEREKVKG